jgi:inhibitor of KinA sporulation pathway (predicted exonuclease)
VKGKSMSKAIDPKVLVIDVEATCWEEPERPKFGEISEIIEIGITVVDFQKLTIGGTDSIIIRPQHSRVSKFCTKLTTLTQEIVDQGCSFEAAMAILRKNYNSEHRTMISWGDYDRKMFERNCLTYHEKYPFGPRHLNLKNAFTLLHGLDREPGMDAALDLLGMPLEGIHHRGSDDSRNIAKIFINTMKKFRGLAP